ncbi:uroporphyrinogen-III C-methyltransferase [Vineibacter terrae]|uniref:Uroporphyrinogen-III C-methyltransferase n=1 Tax=Vineibacter terrae TaxID=2586908 RepID=A0A5C8P6E0_9HYPH|nr:siroheme synthase CysG [Vineibacter terrae]TXL69179.1 uroporphyrinogen-III C-methyltransferase [Vineibacter terrae]
MKHLPTFFALDGRAALVVGGTPAAAQRARLLLAAGARVTVAAPGLDAAFDALLGTGAIAWQARWPGDEDIDRAALAFIATGDPGRDHDVAARARAARVPVNVTDQPGLSDFIMPAIVDRGDVVVAVSTGGAAPVLARLVRARIERALPARLADLGAFAARFRDSARALFRDVGARRRFWERVLDGPIGQLVLAGREPAARDAMLVALNRADAATPRPGSVTIVGAGPGDPDLLTLRALHALQQADIVLYDELAGRAVLDYARRDAELVYVGKQKAHHSKSQDEINALMVAHARAGRQVVRLKGGDPFVFGRGGEEQAHLRAHGIEATVVPGITAALACAAAAGIPLTHREHASAVTFVTGHLKNGEPAADWAALARSGQTIVVYMGVSAAATVRDRLLAAGIARATPAAIVENGARPNQKVSIGTVAGLAALAARHVNGGPALMIIGDVAALADTALEPALAEAS